MHLEDIVVSESARGGGHGVALFEESAAHLPASGGYARFEWRALDWNVDAARFYTRPRRAAAARMGQLAAHPVASSGVTQPVVRRSPIHTGTVVANAGAHPAHAAGDGAVPTRCAGSRSGRPRTSKCTCAKTADAGSSAATRSGTPGLMSARPTWTCCCTATVPGRAGASTPRPAIRCSSRARAASSRCAPPATTCSAATSRRCLRSRRSPRRCPRGDGDRGARGARRRADELPVRGGHTGVHRGDRPPARRTCWWPRPPALEAPPAPAHVYLLGESRSMVALRAAVRGARRPARVDLRQGLLEPPAANSIDRGASRGGGEVAHRRSARAPPAPGRARSYVSASADFPGRRPVAAGEHPGGLPGGAVGDVLARAAARRPGGRAPPARARAPPRTRARRRPGAPARPATPCATSASRPSASPQSMPSTAARARCAGVAVGRGAGRAARRSRRAGSGVRSPSRYGTSDQPVGAGRAPQRELGQLGVVDAEQRGRRRRAPGRR